MSHLGNDFVIRSFAFDKVAHAIGITDPNVNHVARLSLLVLAFDTASKAHICANHSTHPPSILAGSFTDCDTGHIHGTRAFVRATCQRNSPHL
jgi:hypothetical protein